VPTATEEELDEKHAAGEDDTIQSFWMFDRENQISFVSSSQEKEDCKSRSKTSSIIFVRD
jgi:hypothetical protein